MVNIPCALGKNVCSAVVRTGAPCLSIWSNWFVVLFKSSTFVLISVVKRRVNVIFSAGGFVILGLLAFVLCDLSYVNRIGLSSG